MLRFAAKLTLMPWEVMASDLEDLRTAGLGEREILELVEVTSYFNFVARLTLGLGVELEPELDAERLRPSTKAREAIVAEIARRRGAEK